MEHNTTQWTVRQYQLIEKIKSMIQQFENESVATAKQQVLWVCTGRESFRKAPLGHGFTRAVLESFSRGIYLCDTAITRNEMLLKRNNWEYMSTRSQHHALNRGRAIMPKLIVIECDYAATATDAINNLSSLMPVFGIPPNVPIVIKTCFVGTKKDYDALADTIDSFDVCDKIVWPFLG